MCLNLLVSTSFHCRIACYVLTVMSPKSNKAKHNIDLNVTGFSMTCFKDTVVQAQRFKGYCSKDAKKR